MNETLSSFFFWTRRKFSSFNCCWLELGLGGAKLQCHDWPAWSFLLFSSLFLLFIFTFKVYPFSSFFYRNHTKLHHNYFRFWILSRTDCKWTIVCWGGRGVVEHKLDGRNSVFAKMPPFRVCRFVGPSHSYGEKLQNVISCHTRAPSWLHPIMPYT